MQFLSVYLYEINSHISSKSNFKTSINTYFQPHINQNINKYFK